MEEKDYWYDFDSAMKSEDLIQAEFFARKIDGEWQIAQSLIMTARKYSDLGQKEKSIELLNEAVRFGRIGEQSESIQDSLDSSSVLAEIAEEIAVVNNLENAKVIAESILNERKRSWSLENLSNIAKGEKGYYQKHYSR